MLPEYKPLDRSKMSAQHQAIADIHEAKWSAAQREEYHKHFPERFAGPDGSLSFPISDAEDVEHAAHLYGHSPEPEKTKHKIVHIAKALGLTHALPESWMEEVDCYSPDGESEENYYTGEPVKEAIVLQGRITEDQPDAARLEGSEIRVTVLKGGKSINGYFYNQEALQEVSRLIEGARAYSDHGRTPADDQVRSIRDLVGFYHNAQYIAPHYPDNPTGRVDATLHILEAAGWLRSMVKEAITLGRPELVGLSVDIFGTWQHSDAHKAKDVTRVLSLNSCDIVTRPSAGGSIQRILHHSSQGDSMPDSKKPAAPSTTQQETPVTPSAPAPAPEPSPVAPQQHIVEQVQAPIDLAEVRRIREEQEAALAQLRAEQEAARQLREEQQRIIEQAKLDRCAALLDRQLAACNLPQAVQAQIRSQFEGRIFEASELESNINNMRTMLAGLASTGLIRDMGYEHPAVGEMITEAEKLQAAFDLMFEDSKASMLSDSERARFAGVRGFTSIREAYVRITGDSDMSGMQVREPGRIRVSENAPIARMTEADTTTASFSYLLGTSMNKRLLKDYQAWPAEWQKWVVITPIKDFKQQTRVRLGAFGSLSTVPEDTAYTTISLTDTAATYVPTKRGNLVTVSRETIINDDLQAIKQIPTKLAVAAAYTLAEFVYSFLSTNPNIYDGSALFTSGAPHANLGAANLSSAAMQTGVTAMREQTNFAGKRLGLRPSFLVVPPELEWTAMVVTKSAGVPGSNNNDINPMLGYVQPIVSPQLSSSTQWFLVADPKTIDTVEIGFVGGQVNPALFIQDQPLFGLNFTQDVISYKVRHEYGGAVLDFRGMYRGI